ncbi:MAG: acyl-CoA dehydrogenase [bacterium]
MLALGFGFYGAPFWLWSVGFILITHGLSSSYVITSSVTGAFVLINLLFYVKPIRRTLISGPILGLVNSMGLAPEISETQQTALEAGDIGLEEELFSGRPDFDKLNNAPMSKLSDEEQAFLDGPVEELCKVVDDWEIWDNHEYPQEAWNIIEEHRFFGLIIPEEYDGAEMSPAINSAIVQKLASRSLPLAITVMVPNSLGPAELLLHYGTEEQKDYYLPRLAKAEEIPCFGLTEPKAGSDAGSITSRGEVFKDDNGELKIRLNFEKRWITLSPIATVVGLAFQLYDPENHLGKGEELGITCALVPADSDGLNNDRFHNPLGVPFYNGPLKGEDVVISVDDIIGGPEWAGKGWQMLMESLSVGRGISLPATAAGSSKLTSRVVSSHSYVRRQFGIRIGKFEGVEEPLARIGGLNYVMEGMRKFTCGQLLGGSKPAVISAMAKYNLTEMGRQVINDGMDIRAGSGITRGPKNMLSHSYIGTPISITVEGANILTRTMIIFGQGAIRCHPYLFDEFMGMMEDDLPRFDEGLWNHIGHSVQNAFRAGILSVTRGLASLLDPAIPNTRDHQRLAWASSSFAFLADIGLGTLGGAMKRKEKISGRFADIFSWMVMITASIRQFEEDGRPEGDRPFFRWSMEYGFHKIQEAFDGLYQNFPVPLVGTLLKWTHGVWSQLNPIGQAPSDQLEHTIAQTMQIPGEDRLRRTEGIYDPPADKEEPLGHLEMAFRVSYEADQIVDTVEEAVESGKLEVDGRPSQNLDQAVDAGVISNKDKETVERARNLRTEGVQVDDFPFENYGEYG